MDASMRWILTVEKLPDGCILLAGQSDGCNTAVGKMDCRGFSIRIVLSQVVNIPVYHTSVAGCGTACAGELHA